MLKGDANQAHLACEIKRSVGQGVAVATMGNIASAKVADEQIRQGLDAVCVGRHFLKDPKLVANWGRDLGVDVTQAHQLSWMLPRPQLKSS